MTEEPATEQQNPLLNAPPCLSALQGDDRTKALKARAEMHKQAWLQSRQHLPFGTRLRALVERIPDTVAKVTQMKRRAGRG